QPVVRGDGDSSTTGDVAATLLRGVVAGPSHRGRFHPGGACRARRSQSAWRDLSGARETAALSGYGATPGRCAATHGGGTRLLAGSRTPVRWRGKPHTEGWSAAGG